MRYFAKLSKLGSENARPVYRFMKAIAKPSRKSFKKAIESCSDAKFVHLEAMATERFAAYLRKTGDESQANFCLTNAYWLYLGEKI